MHKIIPNRTKLPDLYSKLKKKKQAGITFIPHNIIFRLTVFHLLSNDRYKILGIGSTYYVVGFYKPNIISDVEKLTRIK